MSKNANIDVPIKVSHAYLCPHSITLTAEMADAITHIAILMGHILPIKSETIESAIKIDDRAIRLII